MMWSVEFRSDRFLPVLPEDRQVNNGVYGFELAWWLAQELARRGILCTYPDSEDWGWYLAWHDDACEFQIGCASMTLDGEGYRGQAVDWTIHLSRHKRLSERWRGAPDDSGWLRLRDAIQSALADAGIAPGL